MTNSTKTNKTAHIQTQYAGGESRTFVATKWRKNTHARREDQGQQISRNTKKPKRTEKKTFQKNSETPIKKT